MNTPKPGIVIPLKSKGATRNWDATTAALRYIIASTVNQSNVRYVVAIAEHGKPKILNDKQSWNMLVTSLDTVPPTLTNAAHFGSDKPPFIVDKNQKIVRVMQLQKETEPTNWFDLETDDLITKAFASRALRSDCQNGETIDAVYFLYQRHWRKKSMSTYCGSSSVLPVRDCEVPPSIEPEALGTIPSCKNSHSQMHDHFTSRARTEYKIVCEPLHAYTVGHRANCSDDYWQTRLVRLKTRIITGVEPKRGLSSASPDVCCPFGETRSTIRRCDARFL